MSTTESSSDASDARWELRKKIQACQLIDHFVVVYSEPAFADCLERLESALLSREGMNREERAMVWAQDLSNQEDNEAREDAHKLNNDKKLAKKFLMTLCDCPTVTEDDIVNEFKTNRVKRIMRVCLVYDRADAWYHLTNTQTRGKPWYAEVHTETMNEWRHLRGAKGHTINRRYLQLMEIEGLQLRADRDLCLLLTPAQLPRAGGAVGAGRDRHTDQNEECKVDLAIDMGMDQDQDEEHAAEPLIQSRGAFGSAGEHTWRSVRQTKKCCCNKECMAAFVGGFFAGVLILLLGFFINKGLEKHA